MLRIEDNITYAGYTFCSCTWISYNGWYVCKHTIALAIELELRLKGFELKTNSTENRRRGRPTRLQH